jgi:hypothetical protein
LVKMTESCKKGLASLLKSSLLTGLIILLAREYSFSFVAVSLSKIVASINPLISRLTSYIAPCCCGNRRPVGNPSPITGVDQRHDPGGPITEMATARSNRTTRVLARASAADADLLKSLALKNEERRQSRVSKLVYGDSYRGTFYPTPSEEMHLQKRRPSPTDRLQECVICYEDRYEWEFPKTSITSECQHKIETCLECIGRDIQRCLDNSGWAQVRCISGGCNSELQYSEIKRLAFREDFEKFVTLLQKLPVLCIRY